MVRSCNGLLNNCPYASSEPTKGENIRGEVLLSVMSFNVLGATVRAESQPWSIRGPMCVELINRHGPDVLAVQELEPGNFETFVASLTDYEYELGPIGAYRQIGYQSKNPHNYNAVFWKRGVLSRFDSGGFWLSDTPDRPS